MSDGFTAPVQRKHTLEWQQQFGDLPSPSSSAKAAEMRRMMRRSLAEMQLQGSSSPRPTNSTTSTPGSVTRPVTSPSHMRMTMPGSISGALNSVAGASSLSPLGQNLGQHPDSKRRLNLSVLQIPSGSLTASLASASASSSPVHLPLTSPLQAAANALLLAQPALGSSRLEQGTPGKFLTDMYQYTGGSGQSSAQKSPGQQGSTFSPDGMRLSSPTISVPSTRFPVQVPAGSTTSSSRHLSQSVSFGQGAGSGSSTVEDRFSRIQADATLVHGASTGLTGREAALQHQHSSNPRQAVQQTVKWAGGVDEHGTVKVASPLAQPAALQLADRLATMNDALRAISADH